MGSTVLVTDHVFGGVEMESRALAEAGYELREAPDVDEATLVELARDATALMVCFAQVQEPVVSAAAEGGCRIIARYVTEVEPLPEDHPLRTHPRALITPHMSFHSAEASEDLQRRTVEEVLLALSGEPPRSPVNPEVLENTSSARSRPAGCLRRGGT